MNDFFEKLSFKQKIIFGFTMLSAILILGMGYMLLKFNDVSKISTDIIEKRQPIDRYASDTSEYSQSAANDLHKYLLKGQESYLSHYSKTIKNINDNLLKLLEYAEDPKYALNEKELKRACDILEEIDSYVVQIKRYVNSFEENHPVINRGAAVLNPLALEYLGIINSIIDQNKSLNIPSEVLVMVSNMRHSWTQMMSSLRITLATRQAREFTNVRAYADVNKLQLERIKKTKYDLGFFGLDELERIRTEYMKELDITINQFNTNIWRMDAHVMTTNVMPLFDELNMYLDNLSRIQLKQEKNTDKLLSQQLKISRYSYVALILVSFIIAFYISVFITRSLRKPLIKLAAASNDVAHGKYDTEIVVTGDDEISELSQSFNEMVTKIKESQLALTRARDAAENANKVKSEFLTRMSHELRTPLNAILGFAQVMNIESDSDKGIDQKHIKNILKSGEHLLDLVEELLDLSQIETNTIFIKNEEKDILPLIQECVDISRSMASNSNEPIIFDTPKDCTCFLRIDPVRFKQVVLNLLTNAVKYNSEQGKVTVKCKYIKDNTFRMSVCDQGAGLTKEQEIEVFDAFQRLNADDQSIEGIGVGLSIAKNLVELMDGEIGVDSKEGEGSCFWIEFPSVELTVKEETANTETKEVSSSKNKIQYKVLYVEDDEFNLEVVRDILEIMCPEITLMEAMTAEAGFDVINNEIPDLILMDINLPGMSGHEALVKLRNDDKTKDIPVIAISADAVKESIEKAESYGFNEYVTKPINVDDFVEVLNTTLNNK